MTFLKAWNNFWGKRFNISDRATRPEFWMMFPFFFVLPWLFSIYVFNFSSPNSGPILLGIYGFFLIITVIPFMTLAARRFNDIGLPVCVPILVIGIYESINIFSIFFNMNFGPVRYIMDYIWMSYVFILGACIAPSGPHKK